MLEKIYAALNDGQPARSVSIDDNEYALVQDSHLLTIKPVLYVANVSEEELDGSSPYVQKVRDHAEATGSGVVVVCGSIESELAELEEEEQAEMLEALGIQEPALNLLVRATYKLLGLQSFFTAGEIEIRAWTIPVGATAPQAAGVIHSDFEKHFIRAEVFTVDDLAEHESESQIKAAGKMRLEGKEYVVTDGDIMHFRHSA